MVLGLFGAGQRNRDRVAQENRQFRADNQQFKFNEDIREDNYDYQVESQEAQVADSEANLRFLENKALQDYDYATEVQDYEFDLAQRAYEKSVQQANQQKSFNVMAAQVAGLEQNAKLRDDLLSVMFDESQTFLDFSANSTGLKVDRRNQLVDADVQYAFTSDNLFFDQQNQLTSADYQFASNKQNLKSKQNNQLVDANYDYESTKAALDSNKNNQLVDADSDFSSTMASLKFTKENQLIDSDFKYATALTNAEFNKRNQLVEAGFKDASLQNRFLGNIAKFQLERRKAQGESQIEAQRAIIAGMKAAGELRSSGTAGRSSTKNVLGVMAESGAIRASIASGLMYAEQGIDLGMAQLKDMLILEQTMVLASRDRANNSFDIQSSMLAQEKGISKDRANNAYDMQGNLLSTQTSIRKDRANNESDLQSSLLDTKTSIRRNQANNEYDMQSDLLNVGDKITRDRTNNTFDLKSSQLDLTDRVARDRAENQFELGSAKLDADLALDQMEIAATRTSIRERDEIVRRKIQNSLIQANINADAAILLQPQPLPDLVDPRDLYAEYDNPDTDYVEMFLRPTVVDLPEFREAPGPNRGTYRGPRENVLMSNIGDALTIGGMVAGGIGSIGAIGIPASGTGGLLGMNTSTANSLTTFGKSLGALGSSF